MGTIMVVYILWWTGIFLNKYPWCQSIKSWYFFHFQKKTAKAKYVATKGKMITLTIYIQSNQIENFKADKYTQHGHENNDPCFKSTNLFMIKSLFKFCAMYTGLF